MASPESMGNPRAKRGTSKVDITSGQATGCGSDPPEIEVVTQSGLVEVADTEGRVYYVHQSSYLAHWAAGRETLTPTIVMAPRTTRVGGLRVTDAARQHLDDIDGITLDQAKSKISYACRMGAIASTGQGMNRRIDPTSFGKWRLDERTADLAERDELPS